MTTLSLLAVVGSLGFASRRQYDRNSVVMRIEGIIWLRTVVDKLAFKHRVEIHEVEELFAGEPKFRFVEKGEREGENVYIALGQADAGRYLTVLFIYKKTKEALILSARDMAEKERKMYGRK
jgi:uncharacterized DUF497 family protein